ncbi:MAG: hypothetical protein CR994_06150 [Maribacter sp.]|nr:MAG: hypothetical protein CR994_06150 [Maribacter sp.]
MSFPDKTKKNVLQNVPVLGLKKQYTISFYTAGTDPANPTKSTLEQKAVAIKKDWYIRWSYRNPKTGKLEQYKSGGKSF